MQIWGGFADPARHRPWTERTLTPLASTTKALATISLLTLVDRGLVELAEPVATYWPAFGQRGKADIPVHLVLSHRSGVAALDAPVSNNEAADLEPVLRRIERQPPWWPPGARHGYHAVTFGFLAAAWSGPSPDALSVSSSPRRSPARSTLTCTSASHPISMTGWPP